MNRLAILGGGSWGTALAAILAPNFSEVRLWVHNPDLARSIATSRINTKYLSGVALPDNVAIDSDPSVCLADARFILIAVPSAYLRDAVGSVLQWIPPDVPVVSATKGLEPGSMLRMSQVIAVAANIAPDRVVALTGPSFAAEVARGLPTAVVVAGRNEPSRQVQAAFVRPSFRVYSSEDIIGVEIGGALKNVIAIGAGMIAGIELGHNAVAALITRGLAEITRLAVQLGAEPRTLSGLAGLGDLVLTCTGELSRNRALGISLIRQETLDLQPPPRPMASEVLYSSTMTTEGVRAARVAVGLGHKFGVEMPISTQIHQVLEFGRSPKEALRQLMDRSLKEE